MRINHPRVTWEWGFGPLHLVRQEVNNAGHHWLTFSAVLVLPFTRERASVQWLLIVANPE